MSKIFIIIVTWNSGNEIVRCMQALCGRQEDIIVIDNNSKDNTVNIIKDTFPDVFLIANIKNIKLSPALNQGIHYRKSNYYFIINPDVVVYENTVRLLINYLDCHPDVGIVGPKLLNLDKTVQYSCRTFPALRTVIMRGMGFDERFTPAPIYMRKYLMMDYDHNQVAEVDWILGAALMIRRECIEDLGGFDEHYPQYYGDIDLCWRAKKHGWKVVYNPEVVAMHHYQRSSAHGGILNPLKWSHARSALRFLVRKYFL